MLELMRTHFFFHEGLEATGSDLPAGPFLGWKMHPLTLLSTSRSADSLETVLQ